MTARRLRIGVAGLGRAFGVMLPTLRADPRVQLVAAADPRGEATRRFAGEFGASAHASIEELCADDRVEAVYIATPHEHHCAHATLAASCGKHVLVEKPMAISLAECTRMIDAAKRAGVTLIVGHSHSFDRPIRRTREIIDSGAVGALRMIHAQYYTDFLYRPRRPEELVTARGGGVVFSQGAHQVDIVRLLGGGRVTSVRAQTGAWDPERPTEGAYAALLEFEGGAFASLTYSGYAHFDGDELCGGRSELGLAKEKGGYGAARRMLHGIADASAEAALKQARNYGAADGAHDSHATRRWHEHFGFVLASCERADLRPLPDGVMVYDDAQSRLEALPPPAVPRAEVIDELYGAIVERRPPRHDGAWGRATLEVCLAILASARERRDVALTHQVALRP